MVDSVAVYVRNTLFRKRARARSQARTKFLNICGSIRVLN